MLIRFENYAKGSIVTLGANTLNLQFFCMYIDTFILDLFF